MPFSPFPAAQGHAQHAPIEALAAFLNVAGDPDFQRPMWQVLLGHEGLRKLSGQLCQDGVDLVWSGRFPLISEAALRNRNSSFVIDGEAVLPGVDGRSDFNGLHSRKHDAEVQFYAFDILVSDGEDVRRLPLSMRKSNLARLLARRVDGIFLSDFEQGEIGQDLFRHSCLMGLEGMVSKHRESSYRGGRYDRWIKVKNRQHPAFGRVMDQFGLMRGSLDYRQAFATRR